MSSLFCDLPRDPENAVSTRKDSTGAAYLVFNPNGPGWLHLGSDPAATAAAIWRAVADAAQACAAYHGEKPESEPHAGVHRVNTPEFGVDAGRLNGVINLFVPAQVSAHDGRLVIRLNRRDEKAFNLRLNVEAYGDRRAAVWRAVADAARACATLHAGDGGPQ